jgi:hypothetical protein
VAHEPTEEVAWEQLDQDVIVIAVALGELGLADAIPQWKVFSERSSSMAGQIPNAIVSYRHRVAIQGGEGIVAEIAWWTHIMRDGET